MCTVCHGVGSKTGWQKHVRLHAPSQHVECGRRRGESCASRRFRVYRTRTFNSKCNPWATWASQLPRSRPVASRGARFHAARMDAAGAPNCATVAISGGPWGESHSLKIYMYRAAGPWPDALARESLPAPCLMACWPDGLMPSGHRAVRPWPDSRRAE